jgi:hypothetical protein
MKTTIELAPALLDSAKRLARREGRTLRALVEEGLRHVLASRGSRQAPFRLPDARFKGRGVQPGVEEGRWADLRDQIYEGRGA